MAQKYYNSSEVAAALGVNEDEVKKMLDRKELHGYRDGADWKFKAEDIDALVKERGQAKAPAEGEGEDVLLSEVELGHSDPGTSGTVIAMNWVDRGVTDSDIRLADSDITLSENARTPIPRKKGDTDPKGKKAADLDRALEEDLTLKDSSVALAAPDAPEKAGSAVDLAGEKPGSSGDLVLGGSEAGSDVTLGGDSGISLVDPSDSGLSLEEPILNLGAKGEESLELGEDDLLATTEQAAEAAPAPVKTDDDFLLTPLKESVDAQESDSGSQVIALDTEGEEAGMGGISAGIEGMGSMLEEDVGAQPAMETLDLSAPALAAQPAPMMEGVALVQPSATLPEMPYSGWMIALLACCVVLLILCGMMTYDLLRSMWGWGEPYSVNSSIMDTILGLFEGK